MAHDVFISYSTKNKAVADAVCARFESGGLRCWYAPRDIEPGADWAGSIIDAIGSSKVMILIFTPDSNASKQVLREVDCAVGAGVTVIPLRLTEDEPIDSMRYYLSAVHWLDAVDADLDASIDELYLLAKAVKETGGGAAAPSPVPAKKKTPLIKKLIAPLVALALIAAAAIVFIPKLTGKEDSPVKTESASKKKDDVVTGADAPVGEKSKNAGIEPEHYIEGTTQGNIRAGGYIAYDDGWYYFRSNDSEKLYRMREDGSEAEKLSDHSAKNITVHDGYVYFEEEHGYVGIYRVRTDGTDETQIFGSETSFMGVIDDKLYFMDSYYGLCTLDLTEEDLDMYSDRTEVYHNEDVTSSIFEMCFDGENIYFTTFRSNGIYRVSISEPEKEPEKIVNSDVSDVVLAGDYLYYNDLKEGRLKAYEITSGKSIAVYSSLMSYYHIRSDGIYGADCSDNTLVRYDPSTGSTYKLSDRQVAYVCVANEKIFYWDFIDYCVTDLTGRNKIKV